MPIHNIQFSMENYYFDLYGTILKKNFKVSKLKPFANYKNYGL